MTQNLKEEICIRLMTFSERMHRVVDADNQREMNSAIVEIRNCVDGLVKGMEMVNAEAAAHGCSAKENITYMVDVLRASCESVLISERLEALESVKASVDELYRGLELSSLVGNSDEPSRPRVVRASGPRPIGETDSDEDAGLDTPSPTFSEDSD
jgi:hypothetical protein